MLVDRRADPGLLDILVELVAMGDRGRRAGRHVARARRVLRAGARRFLRGGGGGDEDKGGGEGKAHGLESPVGRRGSFAGAAGRWQRVSEVEKTMG